MTKRKKIRLSVKKKQNGKYVGSSKMMKMFTSTHSKTSRLNHFTYNVGQHKSILFTYQLVKGNVQTNFTSTVWQKLMKSLKMFIPFEESILCLETSKRQL